MQELTFNQVEEVSGAFIINPITVGVAINAVNYGVAAYRAYRGVKLAADTFGIAAGTAFVSEMLE